MFKLPVINTLAALNARLQVRVAAESQVQGQVDDIIARVIAEGDAALRALTRQFDGVDLDGLRVPADELDRCRDSLAPELLRAVTQAGDNIRRFHQRQLPAAFDLQQPDGTNVAWKWRPVRRVGIYVPGGRYPLVSTALMNIIPAQIAGVAEIALCSPPSASGLPADDIIGVCALLGVTELYALGGAQAIAALAYGTESVAPVDRITGPGNIYVAQAKRSVAHRVGVDMAAGPTEVVVLADHQTDPALVAAELVSQAEHDPLAMPVLITPDGTIIERVNDILAAPLSDPATSDTVRESLTSQGFACKPADMEAAIEMVNAIAPEHLCLYLAQPEQYIDRFIAGTIFLGAETPVAWGDYWAGPNHTLPTGGQARFRGPLAVTDFLVPYSVVRAPHKLDGPGGDVVRTLARCEGLAAHADSVEIRRTHAQD